MSTHLDPPSTPTLQEALKDAHHTLDALAGALSYLGLTAEDAGLREVLILLSNRACQAEQDIAATLEAAS